jgi:hypothetical protein
MVVGQPPSFSEFPGLPGATRVINRPAARRFSARRRSPVIATDHETTAQQATPIVPPQPPAEAVTDARDVPIADVWTIECSESGA